MVLIDLGAGLIQHGVEPQLAAFREAMAHPSVITRMIRDEAVYEDYRRLWRGLWEAQDTAEGQLAWIKIAWLLDTLQQPDFLARGEVVRSEAAVRACDFRPRAS